MFRWSPWDGCCATGECSTRTNIASLRDAECQLVFAIPARCHRLSNNCNNWIADLTLLVVVRECECEREEYKPRGGEMFVAHGKAEGRRPGMGDAVDECGSEDSLRV
jgi:hypothetical protein